MDPERKLIASDAETGEYREGTVLYLSDASLPRDYCATFVSAVEVLFMSIVIFILSSVKFILGRGIKRGLGGLSAKLVVFFNVCL